MHDYLTQRGGAERVVLSMLKAFPAAPLYTSLYEPADTYPEFAAYDIRPMWPNRVRALRADHRRGLPIYPLAFSHLHLDPEPDVVLCSSSGFAHGVRTTARKVVYCYSPPRWLYDKAPSYLAAWPLPLRTACRVASPGLRAWDRRSALSANRYLTSSPGVAADILKAYGLEATVFPPPIQVEAAGERQPIEGLAPGFVLCVSRLLTYKNIDAVVAAFRQLPHLRLVVVGEGPERKRLTAIAPSNVTIAGRVSEAELRWLYASCFGLVSAGLEDFGLTPIEGAAFGKPVVALRAGGFLDTVIEGRTGLFFDAPSAPAIAAAVLSMLASPWSSAVLVDHADSYAELDFILRLRSVVLGPSVEVADMGSGTSRAAS